MKSNTKPHLRLTRQGWLAKIGQSNAIGETPQQAIRRLSEFLAEQRR